MQEIGFSLYTDMLNAAVASLRQGREPDMAHPLGVTTEINLHTPALLPNDYCGDIHQRLMLYKRLANCNTPEELDDMHQELIDRFGLLPEPAQTLLDSHRLRILAKTARHQQGGCIRRSDPDSVHPESADRPDEDHHDDPEQTAHQDGRAGQVTD